MTLYNELYYQRGCGRPYQRTDEWLTFFATVADHIIATLRPRTVLDVGCAMGFLVEGLRARGVEAYGTDVSDYAISQVHPTIAPYCHVGSLTAPWEAPATLRHPQPRPPFLPATWPARYDLVVTIEVLEHLPVREARPAVANLCRLSDQLLFSSTPLDFTERTHLNVRPPAYWASLFAEQGFFHDVDYDATYLTDWAMRLRRRDLTTAELVAAYERRLWPLTQEHLAREELNRELARYEEQLAAAHEERAAMEAHLAQAEARLSILSTQVAQWEPAIDRWQELQSTMGWGALQALQRLRGTLLPPGTWRERALLRAYEVWQTLKLEGAAAAWRRLRASPAQTAAQAAIAAPYAFATAPHVPAADRLRLAHYTIDTPTSPCVILRLTGPAAFPQSGIEIFPGTRWDADPPVRLPAADTAAVVIQRDFLRHAAAYQRVLEHARARDLPVVYELDDLLLDLPEAHPDHDHFAEIAPRLRAELRAAAAVIVSTLPLAEQLRALNPNVWVLPNYLDDRLWQIAEAPPPPPDEGPVVIGYMGGYTPSHMPDLEMVLPVLQRLLEQLGPRVELRLMGLQPPALAGLPNVSFIAERFADYPDFARFFSQQHFDIVIAPLVANPFNRCKSWLKYLEYSAIGAPGVYSRVAPYEALVIHGENGFLAATPEEWEEHLRRLIDSPALRQRIATAALATVRRLRLSEHAHEWAITYRAALAGAPHA